MANKYLRWMAIANPVSLKKRKIDPNLLHRKLEVLHIPLQLSQRPGDACELTRNATEYDGIIAIGGDGTLHEVASHLIPGQALGLIPSGTGNSVARDFSMSALRNNSLLYVPQKIQTIDSISVELNSHVNPVKKLVSVNTIGIGYAANVTLLANRHFKFMGVASYGLASLLRLFGRSKINYRVRYDDMEWTERKMFGLLVNNSCHIAGFVAFKNSSITDGLADVMELTTNAFFQLLQNTSALAGLPVESFGNRYWFKQIGVRFPEQSQVMVDGEIYSGIMGMSLQVNPKSLELYKLTG